MAYSSQGMGVIGNGNFLCYGCVVSFTILHQSELLLIVDKPAGWLTTPARSKDDPRPCLGRELQSQLGATIFPVHRLDFEVSGLTLWAKTADAHRQAQNWFEFLRIDKIYQAITVKGEGQPPQTLTDWNSRLVRGKKRAFEAAHGKPAHTRARVYAEIEPHWYWELWAMTGRPHQLRYEMHKHGSPILGDVLYGAAALPIDNWLALRAVELNLSRLAEHERLGLPAVCRGPELILPESLAHVKRQDLG